ncbi:hypothetical protein IV203_000981 [Nitzschia inconspicua]|uniref:Uncharacterized protein n=1 Tax=Nitzschia inconspicua TaxID=303405 RepID=A0A9K3L7G4_9STRA|nr:hypothetical protein IV203_000981 [Nitzschia inconspicua]
MNIHTSNHFWPFSGLVLLAELVLALQTTVIAFNAPFLSSDFPSTRSFLSQSAFPLYTSLTIPPESRSSEFNKDNDDVSKMMKKKEKNHDITIEKFGRHHQHDGEDEEDNYNISEPVSESVTSNKSSQRRSPGKKDPFYAYLYGMTRQIYNSNVLANRVDDELKRMETRFFNLLGDDIPLVRYPLSIDSRGYNKKPCRPSLQVYELVASAYGRARLRKEGGWLAEDVLNRFQLHNPEAKLSMKLLGAVMKAWIGARDFEKTEYWLRRMEELFPNNVDESSNDVGSVPLLGYQIYHPLVVGLQTMRAKKSMKIADLSRRAIETMRANHESTLEKNCGRYLPSNFTYIAAMENIKHSGYSRVEQFDRIETLFRYQLEDYQRYGQSFSKPTADSGKLVFVAAGRCDFPKDYFAIEKCELLLEDLHNLYRETGNPDFRPVPRMYERMMSMYARMNRRKNPLSFANRTLSLLRTMEEMEVEFEKSFTNKAALNRVMQTAENCMPSDPTENPIKTRDMFQICVDAFKLFHEAGNDKRTLAEPNASTYQIFLRACSHLPGGDTRSNLSTKAFNLCRKNGMVSLGVCRELYAANPELAEKEIGVTMEEFAEGATKIPVDWTKSFKAQSGVDPEILDMGFHNHNEAWPKSDYVR